MSIIELREKLHGYIEHADEQHLSAIFTLVEQDTSESHSHVFDEETIKMLNQRRENHLNGISKSYSVEESFELIRQHKKK